MKWSEHDQKLAWWMSLPLRRLLWGHVNPVSVPREYARGGGGIIREDTRVRWLKGEPPLRRRKRRQRLKARRAGR